MTLPVTQSMSQYHVRQSSQQISKPKETWGQWCCRKVCCCCCCGKSDMNEFEQAYIVNVKAQQKFKPGNGCINKQIND